MEDLKENREKLEERVGNYLQLETSARTTAIADLREVGGGEIKIGGPVYASSFGLDWDKRRGGDYEEKVPLSEILEIYPFNDEASEILRNGGFGLEDLGCE